MRLELGLAKIVDLGSGSQFIWPATGGCNVTRLPQRDDVVHGARGVVRLGDLSRDPNAAVSHGSRSATQCLGSAQPRGDRPAFRWMMSRHVAVGPLGLPAT